MELVSPFHKHCSIINLKTIVPWHDWLHNWNYLNKNIQAEQCDRKLYKQNLDHVIMYRVYLTQ
jgi:hypothetical protein